MKILSTTILNSTPFLDFVAVDYLDHHDNHKVWYGVRRTKGIPAVTIAALTTRNELIFIEQNRPLVGKQMIELPAGLMDIAGETVIETAKRELLEETGYAGSSFVQLVGGQIGLTASAGITDERHYLVLATEVEKVAEPLDDEDTIPRLVPLNHAYYWLESLVGNGRDVDYAMFGTIRIIESYRNQSK